MSWLLLPKKEGPKSRSRWGLAPGSNSLATCQNLKLPFQEWVPLSFLSLLYAMRNCLPFLGGAWLFGACLLCLLPVRSGVGDPIRR